MITCYVLFQYVMLVVWLELEMATTLLLSWLVCFTYCVLHKGVGRSGEWGSGTYPGVLVYLFRGRGLARGGREWETATR